MNDTKHDILTKIQSGEVDMKPRWHFALSSLLLIFGVLTAALIVVYLLSFILFVLRQSGVGFFPLYGFRGLSVFVMSSPWLLIASAGALVVVLQLLVHKYSFSYRQPLLYSVVVLVGVTLLGSYMISQSQLHQQLEIFARERNTPVLDRLYRGIDERQPENIMFGTVTSTSDTGFVLATDRGEELQVIVSKRTRQPRRIEHKVGERVIVFGDRDGDRVDALGVRPAPNDFVPGKPRRGGSEQQPVRIQ